jgi:hypothetical protein
MKKDMNFKFDEREDDAEYGLDEDALGAVQGCLNALGMMIVLVFLTLLIIWAVK